MRPRDAATLILEDAEGRVLLGRRSGGHAFMPGKWVFPGGRLDRGDWHAPVAANLAPEVAAAVGAAPRRPVSDPARLARALALAAVRETFEEAGLVLGAGHNLTRAPAGWQRFLETGFAPDLSRLAYLARAVTPPGRTRRFDARFFLAPAEALVSRTPVASHELTELHWFPLPEAQALDLPTVTRAVLDLVAERREGKIIAPPHWAWRGSRVAD